MQNDKQLLIESIKILEDKKVENLKVIEVSEAMPIADYFLIGTVDSVPQANSVTEELNQKLKNLGYQQITRKNSNQREWILIDFNSVIIHLFTKEKRDFYNLEGLWLKYVKTIDQVKE